MRSSFARKKLIALTTTFTMTLSVSQVAKATELNSVTSDFETAVQSAAPDVPDSQGSALGQATLDAGVVTAPTSEGGEISLTLPDNNISSFGLDDYSTSDEGVSIAVTDEGGGSFRSLLHIPSYNRVNEFEFSFSTDVSLEHLQDGGIVVRDEEGDILGTLAAPWAVDDKGDPVPTWYEIRRNSVVQIVSPNQSTQFPVVVDPFWIPFLGIVGGHFTRHALTRMAQRGISRALVQSVVQSGRASRGNNNTTIFSGNGIRVIVDNNSGNIITVTRG